MSLPWFAFDIAAYVKDTMRLATEGHGAYLLLMLDYYANEAPPPDDDDVLASIAKLPVEVWQAKHRKVMAPFFRVEGGFWHHDRIEAEMLEAHSKVASSHARAVAGGQAYAAKMALRRASSQPEADPKPAKTPKQAPSQAPSPLEATPEAGLEPAHLHKHKTDKEDSSSSYAIGKPIDPSYSLPEPVIDRCRLDGASDAEISSEFEKFYYHHREGGTFSADWDATWGRWWVRWKDHRAKAAKAAEATAAKPKAAPRVVLNGVSGESPPKKRFRAIPDGWKPPDRAYALAKQFGQSVDVVESIFRDYCASSGKLYIDHDAAFCNFIRNQPNFTRGSTNGVRQNSSPGRGSIIAAADDAIAHLEREIAADNEMRALAVSVLPEQ